MEGLLDQNDWRSLSFEVVNSMLANQLGFC
jgi:hypothetical protein